MLFFLCLGPEETHFQIFVFLFCFYFSNIPEEFRSTTYWLGGTLMFVLVNPDCLSDLLIGETAS